MGNEKQQKGKKKESLPRNFIQQHLSGVVNYKDL